MLKDDNILEDNDFSDGEPNFDKDDKKTDNAKKVTKDSVAGGKQVVATAAAAGGFKDKKDKSDISLIDIVKTFLAAIGLILIVAWLWGALFGGGDDNKNDSDDDKQSVQDVDDQEDDAQDQDLTVDLEDEEAKNYLKFDQVSGDEYEITGRVTSIYDDRAADGNAGIIIEDQYRVDTQYGGQVPDAVNEGESDTVKVGDWVEVFATGRKSFSSTASYLMTIFDTEYYVKKIDSPISPDTSASSDDQDSGQDDDQDTPLSSSVEDSDPVIVTKARVNGWDLNVDLSYTGCAGHDFDLVLDEASDDPVPKIKVTVTHDAKGDSCEKETNSSETVNLEPIMKDLDYPSAYDLVVKGTSGDALRSFRVQ